MFLHLKRSCAPSARSGGSTVVVAIRLRGITDCCRLQGDRLAIFAAAEKKWYVLAPKEDWVQVSRDRIVYSSCGTEYDTEWEH